MNIIKPQADEFGVFQNPEDKKVMKQSLGYNWFHYGLLYTMVALNKFAISLNSHVREDIYGKSLKEISQYGLRTKQSLEFTCYIYKQGRNSFNQKFQINGQKCKVSKWNLIYIFSETEDALGYSISDDIEEKLLEVMKSLSLTNESVKIIELLQEEAKRNNEERGISFLLVSLLRLYEPESKKEEFRIVTNDATPLDDWVRPDGKSRRFLQSKCSRSFYRTSCKALEVALNRFCEKNQGSLTPIYDKFYGGRTLFHDLVPSFDEETIFYNSSDEDSGDPLCFTSITPDGQVIDF